MPLNRAAAMTDDIDLKRPDLYINRELSLLEFDGRVHRIAGMRIMSSVCAARMAGRGLGAYPYQRHWPEQTFLYGIVEKCCGEQPR